MGSIRGVDPRAKRHVDDVFPTLQQVMDAAEAVRMLSDSIGWAYLQQFIEAEVELTDRELDRGSAPLSQAEYAMAHGRRGGLLYAQEAIRAISAVADQRYSEQKRKHEGSTELEPEGVL